jgi:hypothetical protein
MQWNVRSINNKIPELENNCNVHEIILVGETWLSCKNILYFNVLV